LLFWIPRLCIADRTNGRVNGNDVSLCNGSVSVTDYECVVARWCEIGPRLLLITNKKSHIQITRESLTLNDFESQYALLWLNGTSYLKNGER